MSRPGRGSAASSTWATMACSRRGSSGAARRAPITPVVEPGFEAHGVTAETLATGVADELGRPPWLFVERKGASVAFHVRQADDIPVARAAVFDAIAAVEARLGLVDHGLRPYRGRSVVDLRPEGAGGKREAVERLIERHRPGAVVSLGDDLSDADAFDAVLAARGVGRTGRGSRWPSTVASPRRRRCWRARTWSSASARDVGRFLAALARRIGAGGASRRSEPGRASLDRKRRDRAGGRLDEPDEEVREQPEHDRQRRRGREAAPHQRAVAQRRARRWPGRACTCRRRRAGSRTRPRPR